MPEFKKQVIETMRREKLSYGETARRFKINSHGTIEKSERIYLTEGPEGFAVERRGRKSTGRPRKLPAELEEDLLAENQRLRAENAYLKKLNGFFRRTSGKRTKGAGNLALRRNIFAGDTA
jgi:transposase-like protein